MPLPSFWAPAHSRTYRFSRAVTFSLICWWQQMFARQTVLAARRWSRLKTIGTSRVTTLVTATIFGTRRFASGIWLPAIWIRGICVATFVVVVAAVVTVFRRCSSFFVRVFLVRRRPFRRRPLKSPRPIQFSRPVLCVRSRATMPITSTDDESVDNMADIYNQLCDYVPTVITSLYTYGLATTIPSNCHHYRRRRLSGAPSPFSRISVNYLRPKRVLTLIEGYIFVLWFLEFFFCKCNVFLPVNQLWGGFFAVIYLLFCI